MVEAPKAPLRQPTDSAGQVALPSSAAALVQAGFTVVPASEITRASLANLSVLVRQSAEDNAYWQQFRVSRERVLAAAPRLGSLFKREAFSQGICPSADDKELVIYHPAATAAAMELLLKALYVPNTALSNETIVPALALLKALSGDDGKLMGNWHLLQQRLCVALATCHDKSELARSWQQATDYAASEALDRLTASVVALPDGAAWVWQDFSTRDISVMLQQPAMRTRAGRKLARALQANNKPLSRQARLSRMSDAQLLDCLDKLTLQEATVQLTARLLLAKNLPVPNVTSLDRLALLPTKAKWHLMRREYWPTVGNVFSGAIEGIAYGYLANVAPYAFGVNQPYIGRVQSLFVGAGLGAILAVVSPDRYVSQFDRAGDPLGFLRAWLPLPVGCVLGSIFGVMWAGPRAHDPANPVSRWVEFEAGVQFTILVCSVVVSIILRIFLFIDHQEDFQGR